MGILAGDGTTTYSGFCVDSAGTLDVGLQRLDPADPSMTDPSYPPSGVAAFDGPGQQQKPRVAVLSDHLPVIGCLDNSTGKSLQRLAKFDGSGALTSDWAHNPSYLLGDGTTPPPDEHTEFQLFAAAGGAFFDVYQDGDAQAMGIAFVPTGGPPATQSTLLTGAADHRLRDQHAGYVDSNGMLHTTWDQLSPNLNDRTQRVLVINPSMASPVGYPTDGLIISPTTGLNQDGVITSTGQVTTDTHDPIDVIAYIRDQAGASDLVTHAFNALTGAQVWEQSTPGIARDPTIASNGTTVDVYYDCQDGGQHVPRVVSLDALTGAPVDVQLPVSPQRILDSLLLPASMQAPARRAPNPKGLALSGDLGQALFAQAASLPGIGTSVVFSGKAAGIPAVFYNYLTTSGVLGQAGNFTFTENGTNWPRSDITSVGQGTATDVLFREQDTKYVLRARAP